MIYLYIKQHNVTGLKYFGKTECKDPFKYKGSGVYWRRHLKIHGNDVSTYIYGVYEDFNLAYKEAVHFSEVNNIVESSEWANLKLETLEGGFDHINKLPKEVRRQKIQEWRNSLTEEERKDIDESKSRPGKQNGMYGVHRRGKDAPGYGKQCSASTKEKISEANKGKIVVKDVVTGEVIGSVRQDDPKVLQGIWVSVNKGTSHSEERRQRMSQICKKLGFKPPSPKGRMWWNNGESEIRAPNCPGLGYIRGRIKRR